MGSDWDQLSPILKLYLVLYILLGTSVLIWVLRSPLLIPSKELLALLIISGLLGPRTVKMGYTQGTRIELMISHPLTFTAYLTLGTPAAVLVSETSLLASLLTTQSETRRYRQFFNFAVFATTTAAAGLAYDLLGGSKAELISSTSILALLGSVLTYYLVNTFSVAIAVGLYHRAPIMKVWHENFMWTSPSYVAGGSIALAMSYFIHQLGIISLILSLPFCVLLYYSYRLYMDRLFEERKHSEEITRINLALEHKVRDRTRELRELNEKLQESNRELKRVSHLKSEFLANMSHELRTPLNAIIGFSELLIDQTFGELNEAQTDYVNDILSSGRHLLDLINDILDLSKIEAGKMSLRVEPFDVEQVVAEAMTTLHVAASKKQIDFTEETPDDMPLFNGDRSKFKQILYNLLSNAIKFTPEHGRVWLTVERRNDEIEVSVHDTGIGIKGAAQSQIFEAFMQVDGSFSRKYQGTGLGLTLVKRFVELHGGRVSVSSEEGKGSRLTFWLPSVAHPEEEARAREAGSHQAATAALAGPERNAELAEQKPADGRARASVAATSEPNPGVIKDTLVLVVEDNPVSMKLMAELLRTRGYRVAESRNAEAALQAAQELGPRIILMDIQLPGMDGLQCTRELKKRPSTCDIPVIALTAHAMKGDDERARAAGCVDYFSKPADTEQILSRIAQYIHDTEPVAPGSHT